METKQIPEMIIPTKDRIRFLLEKYAFLEQRSHQQTDLDDFLFADPQLASIH